MSNYLAVATVTAALQQVLMTPVANAVAHAQVGFSRPDPADSATPWVNVYLYQVTPNAAYRNADLPTRRSSGSLAKRPQAALDLHYIFTFHGDDKNLEPQRLLGAVVTTLHAQPFLSTANINSAAVEYGFLAGSGLDAQVEGVKFTPAALSLEEFSKLWSVFFQVEYNLSVVYHASVVLMEADLAPLEAPPVLIPKLYVNTFRPPTITQVASQNGSQAPVVTGSTLVIQGQHLLAPNTFVMLGGLPRTPASLTDTQITLPAPPDLAAGVQSLQVVQQTSMGQPATLHPGLESNVLPFVMRPTVTVASAVTDPASTATLKISNVTLTVTPNVNAGQRVTLVLNSPAATPANGFASVGIKAAATSNQVTVPIQNVPTGSYLVRAQVDGAESVLSLDGSGQLTGPMVAIP
jgi:Pvc16 N-terminal domain